MTHSSKLRVGTRGSALALRQTTEAREVLYQHLAIDSEQVIIKSEGDADQQTALHQFRDPGIFTRALDRALLAGEIDLAVHSAKDIPTEAVPGVVIAAFLPREDVRDALVLRQGISNEDITRRNLRPIIGVSCPRRTTQWLRHHPHTEAKIIRGNVDRRLQLLDDGTYDGLILAAAGLKRLRLAHRITAFLDWMMPAPGQGAIAICTRPELVPLITTVNHAVTAAAVHAERAFLAGLGSGCSVPAGAFACVVGDVLTLTAAVWDRGTQQEHRIERSVQYTDNQQDSWNLGIELAQEMLTKGVRLA